MSKVTMPEPVAWVSHVTLKTLSRGRSVTAYPEETSWLAHGLITTTQAEAYADVRVMEALVQAESILRVSAKACKSLDVKVLLSANADAIRAMIPPLPGPVEPTT